MSIKHCLACNFVVFFVYSLSPSTIHYEPLNFQIACAMALQREFELSTLRPSIPSNGHVGGLC